MCIRDSNNYLETMYATMLPSTKFLSLVQALESLHSRSVGEFRDGEPEARQKLLEDLAAETSLNSAARTRVKQALEQAEPTRFNLAERIRGLTADTGLREPPDVDLSFLDSGEAKKFPTWPDQIAKLRNTLAHGTHSLDGFIFRKQNIYLQAVLERSILRLLGLSEQHCDAALNNRLALYL